jgi:hypothetical protein
LTSTVQCEQKLHLISTSSSAVIAKVNVIAAATASAHNVLVQVCDVFNDKILVGTYRQKQKAVVGLKVRVPKGCLITNGEALLRFQSNKTSANGISSCENGDAFHVPHRIKVKKHVFRKAFFEAFREALL